MTEYVFEGLDPKTLKGLARFFHARGDLIGKAICGEPLFVSDDLIDGLNTAATQEQVFQCFCDCEYRGFEVSDSEGIKLSFSVEDSNGESMIEHIIKYAAKTSVIKANVKPAENEKYTFRALMLRIGMGGQEYSACRRALLKNLSGNSSYATTEGYIKFKEGRKRNGGKEAQTERVESP